MLLNLGIFFILTELFFITKGGIFWLLMTLVFGIFCFRKSVHSELKKFWLLFPMIFLIFSFLFILKSLNLGFGIGQLFLVVLSGIFYIILRLYANSRTFSYALHILMMLVGGATAFLFFRANILQGFFGKELLLFICLIFLFESDRNAAKILMLGDEELGKTKEQELRLAYTIIPSLVLMEFFWLLNLWPVNVISLVGIWLGVFYLTREFTFLSFRRAFQWKIFLPQIVLVVILIFLLVISASWSII